MSGRAFVDVREKHSGAVVTIDDLACKLKKPVDLGFLDFRSAAQRWADCRREVELNTRLAPDVYLGIGELAAPGRASEPIVFMRRLPDTASLSALLDQGLVTDEMLRQIARRIAVFRAALGGSPASPQRAPGTRSATVGKQSEAVPPPPLTRAG